MHAETAPAPHGHPLALKRILLHLARTREHPEGSARDGYEIVAPLDGAGRLDLAAWRGARGACRVRRFREGERDEHGHLAHRPGGVGGATWAIVYDPEQVDDEEAGYRLGDHVFASGEYVSIRDEDGVLHTFKVASVGPA